MGRIGPEANDDAPSPPVSAPAREQSGAVGDDLRGVLPDELSGVLPDAVVGPAAPSDTPDASSGAS